MSMSLYFVCMQSVTLTCTKYGPCLFYQRYVHVHVHVQVLDFPFVFIIYVTNVIHVH